jgi:RNA polymerase sigma factor (sigma-70 family)
MSVEDDFDDEVTSLYRKYAGRVLGFLINMGCDRGLAEEITDDAFLAARRRWSHVRSLDVPEGYVFKIARNERSRRQEIHEKHAKDLSPDLPQAVSEIPDDPAGEVTDRAVIRQALHQLPPSLREAVTLRHVAGFTEAAAAEIMGVSAGCIKRYTHEGRRRLRVLLAEFRGPREGND